MMSQEKFVNEIKKCETVLSDNVIVVISSLLFFGIFSILIAITGFNILVGNSIVQQQNKICGIYFFIPIIITFIAGYIAFKTMKKELQYIRGSYSKKNYETIQYPWLTIWTSPRATFRRIVDHGPEEHLVLILFMFGGFAHALDIASVRDWGDILPLPAIFLICAIVGPVGGVVGFCVYGALLKWTGGWIGGQGSSVQIRAAIAWSYVPLIWALILWVPELALFGQDIFTSEMPSIATNPSLVSLFFGFVIIKIIIGIWAFIIHLKCIGEVQKFSAWKALGNVLLSNLVIVVIIVPIFIFVS